ncbi:aldehyde dehydrogenase family protein [Streptomyces sp. G-G2]|uniref:aldehyde dehydrogenase family protein n=1 Tax=Streptomyces sp. G-G2 TaxID=3046201 RepID=UPI0024BAACF7|nr:aldehyde dehydrogenase family protein [Streptomyces sp. G-G2]MDJ0386221.1 aldehyde dehydrogenase family protein [Streptomyces sp. G-G2]
MRSPAPTTASSPWAPPVWGTDTQAAYRVAQQLQAGTVWLNESMHLHPQVPFGGHKQSGLGV